MSSQYSAWNTGFLQSSFNYARQGVEADCANFIRPHLHEELVVTKRRMAKSRNWSDPPIYAITRLISPAMKDASSSSVGQDCSIGTFPSGCDVWRDFGMRLVSSSEFNTLTFHRIRGGMLTFGDDSET